MPSRISQPLPVFETPRLIVRPRTLADTEACLATDGDPKVTRFVTGPWSGPPAHRAFIEARTRGPYPDGMGYWAVCPRDWPDSFLGWVVLIPVDTIGPEIEIGWRMRRDAWGRGLATEATMPVLKHAREALDLTAVVADIAPDNVGSWSVAEKIGLTAGPRREHHGRATIRYSTVSM